MRATPGLRSLLLQALAAIAGRPSDLVPVSTLRVRQDDVRQLFFLELEEPSGLRLSANSVSWMYGAPRHLL